jgi:hypothetical protein
VAWIGNRIVWAVLAVPRWMLWRLHDLARCIEQVYGRGWTVADQADLAGFDFADRLASAKWVPTWGFASTGHSPEGRTLQ